MCNRLLNICISLGFHLPSCEPRRRAFPHVEEQPGTSRNDEENPSSREPSLQAPVTHPGMHFPPIPSPPATLHTAGPARSCHVVTLGHFGVNQGSPGVLLPTHSPFHQQEQDFSYGKAKGKAKQKRLLLIVPSVLTKHLNQLFGIK